jgi:hypothetical protein
MLANEDARPAGRRHELASTAADQQFWGSSLRWYNGACMKSTVRPLTSPRNWKEVPQIEQILICSILISGYNIESIRQLAVDPELFAGTSVLCERHAG